MMKNFFDFSNGVKISDNLINMWLNEIKQHIKEGETHWRISSGDTCVHAHVWDNSVYIDVCNSSGYKNLYCRLDEIDNVDLSYSSHIKCEKINLHLKEKS